MSLARRATVELARPAATADGGGWLAEHGLGTALFVPIIHAQRNHGCLALATTAQRPQDPRDVKVLELIARRIALALENSQLYAEQHRVATALQRDLLPGALPDWPGLELATLHRPARSAADVGGDFFDLFDAGDRRMLIVGDVSGKGVEAAATTALVRHAVRVAARSDQPVSERMATVNEAVLQDAPGDQFCTLAWAAFTPEDGAVLGEVACAGHPPPFIVRATGAVEPVAASGTLLGFFHDLRSAGRPGAAAARRRARALHRRRDRGAASRRVAVRCRRHPRCARRDDRPDGRRAARRARMRARRRAR